MASSNPPPSNFPTSMGPGARPIQPGENSNSIFKEIQDVRNSYSINVDETALKLAYNFRGQERRYDLPFSSIPMSGGQQWFLYGGSGRARVTGIFTLDMIRGAENMIGRPLTQAEAEGFSFHAGKRVRYNFAGTLLGFGIGYGIAARTWKTMKFPFIKQKPIEAYDFFPSQRLAILSGSWSRLMWNITRANVYAGISLILAQTLMGSMGDSVMAVGLYRDMRTQEVVKAMKGGFDRIRMNRTQPGQAPPQVQQLPGNDQDPQTADFYGNEGQGMQSYFGKEGDYAGDSAFSDGTADTGIIDDSTARQRESQRDSRQQSYGSTQRAAPQAASPSKSDFFFDDASPTAGNGPDPGTSTSYQPSGSSWERIRRGAQPQPQAMKQPSRQQDNPEPMAQTGSWRGRSDRDFESKSDSFSFSKNDEEKQLAKSQAQKEFDAMLERERREGGSEGYASASFAAETGAETPSQSGGSAWERRRRGS